MCIYAAAAAAAAAAHCKSSMFGASVSIPITKGRLNLGTWQVRPRLLSSCRLVSSCRLLELCMQGCSVRHSHASDTASTSCASVVLLDVDS
jgi:hypothetical protein